jgi:hypothetical protein
VLLSKRRGIPNIFCWYILLPILHAAFPCWNIKRCEPGTGLMKEQMWHTMRSHCMYIAFIEQHLDVPEVRS